MVNIYWYKTQLYYLLDSFNSSIIKTVLDVFNYFVEVFKQLKKYLTLHVDNRKQQKWRTCDFPV